MPENTYDDLSSFDAPIPGESLVTDADNPKPFEQPAQFNDVETAMQDIFETLTEDGRYESILEAMRKEVPIEALTQLILFKGFTEGKWTVDLKLMLLEPTMYLLMWLAAQADIEPVLEIGGDNWEEEEELEERVKKDIRQLERGATPTEQVSNLESAVPSSLLGSMRQFKETE